jgi:hypothetical protein
VDFNVLHKVMIRYYALIIYLRRSNNTIGQYVTYIWISGRYMTHLIETILQYFN